MNDAWGFFLWSNQFVFISSDGSEGNPRIKYQFDAGKPLKLKSIVDGAQVQIFINNKMIHQFQMSGQLASSESDNLVGLWCHRMMDMRGADFKVTTGMFHNLKAEMRPMFCLTNVFNLLREKNLYSVKVEKKDCI